MSPRNPGGHRAWALGFWATGAAGVALAALEASGPPILAARWRLLELLGVWGGVWVLGVLCALRLSRRWAVAAILLVGVAMRVGALDGPPRQSDDLYRYSWDARVQLSGTDPYRYAPGARALLPEREAWLWPDPAVCQSLDRPPGCTRINRPAVRTIYPPVAEAWFDVVYRVGGGVGTRYKLWQGAGLVTEIGSMGLIVALLRRRRRDPRWVALYALSPAPVTAIVNDGHVDGLAILFLLAAFLALDRWRDRRGAPTLGAAVLAGALVGAATSVKLYPAIGLLALWVAPGTRARHRVAATVTTVLVVAAGYIPHVLAVGIRVLGYLPGYLREEQYTGAGHRFLLAGLLHLPDPGGDVVVAVALVATMVFVTVRRPPAEVAATALVAALILCATPVQPWYAVSLLALAAAVGRLRWGAVVAAGYPYFFAVILTSTHQTGIGQAAFACALVLVASAIVVERLRPSPVSSAHPAPQAAGVRDPGPAVQVQIPGGQGAEGETPGSLPP